MLDEIKSENVPRNANAFYEYLRQTKSPIYIFGSDIAGKAVAKLLEGDGFQIQGFLDNNQNKCFVEIGGVYVFHSDSLDEINKNAVILIASTYIADIIAQIEALGFQNWAPISFLVDHHKHADYRALIEGDLQKNHAGGEFTKDFVDFTIDNMVNSQKKYLDESLLFIRSVDLVLTEKCSLKCKDCANLMQYYENPINIQKQELIEDLEDLMTVADEVNEIRIIGGEPLMNKDFHEVSLKAASYKNVNKVVIYTNGTICPPDPKLEQLKNDKVFVFITTYGELSRNADKLRLKLEEFGIQHNCQPAYGWTECGGIAVRERTPNQNREIFKNCCAKHFTTMTDGKLFRCPFSANVERLMAIPKANGDFISVRHARDKPEQLKALKKKLRWFLREKPFLSACDSCNGRTYGDPEITPGIQTKIPLEYSIFDRG
jgi:MoaA/NifB/PqqE/SkfB family radical SAM enzyme